MASFADDAAEWRMREGRPGALVAEVKRIWRTTFASPTNNQWQALIALHRPHWSNPPPVVAVLCELGLVRTKSKS